MPTVRPVRLDDEPTSTARPTRTSAYALRAGEPIQVKVRGTWLQAWIVGSAHSDLRVTLRAPDGKHRHLTKPEREDA